MRKVVSSSAFVLILCTSFTSYAKTSSTQIQQSKTAVSLVSEFIFLEQEYSRRKVPDTYFFEARKRITDEILKLSDESAKPTPEVSGLLRQSLSNEQLSALVEIQKQLLDLEKKYGQSA